MRGLNKLIQYAEDVNNIEKKCYSRLLCISNKFAEIREREGKRIPPSLNIISAILEAKQKNQLDEIKHSQILCSLLNEKHIQESFLETFFGQYHLQGNMQVKAEERHIDVKLDNDKETIIIENKINKAPDRDKQLFSYAEDIKKNHPKRSIFVMYLSCDGTPPGDNSIRNNDKTIYDIIGGKDHLLTYSYKKDILQWLKRYLESIKNEEQYYTEYIKSSLIQYIDYLEYYFKTGTKYEPMNKELDKYLINELGLEDLPLAKTIELLDNKIDNLENLRERLEALSNKYQEKQNKEYFKQWYKECVSIIGDNITIRKTDDYEFGFSFKFRRTEFSCIISMEDNEQPYYWGISGTDSDKNSKPRIFEDLKNYILDSNKGFTNAEDNSDQWVIANYAAPDEIVERFTTLAQLIYDNENCILK